MTPDTGSGQSASGSPGSPMGSCIEPCPSLVASTNISVLSPAVDRVRGDVKLVPVGAAHAANTFRWMQDRTLRRNVGLRNVPTLLTTRRWIARALRDAATCPFAILVAGEHVGNVVLDRIDRHLRTARLSIYIGSPAARGAGVGR